MATSQNGYVANDPSRTQVWTIPGTSRTVRLRKGSPGQVLTLWAAWFHQNVEDIERGIYDDWGYAERPIRGSTTTLSNHASGTALDINATQHPLGKRGTFTTAEAAKIREHLRVFDGCIRWGGDYQNRADEMHFEIAASVAECDALVNKLTTTQEDWFTVATKEDLKAVVTAVVEPLAGDVVSVPKNHPAFNPKNTTVTLQRGVEILLETQADQITKGATP